MMLALLVNGVVVMRLMVMTEMVVFMLLIRLCESENARMTQSIEPQSTLLDPWG